MSAFYTEIQTLLPDMTRFARVLTRNEDDAHETWFKTASNAPCASRACFRTAPASSLGCSP